MSESRASSEALSGITQIAKALEPFADKRILEFSEFLIRSRDYERDGHWSSRNRSISGEIVDSPAPGELASRLRSFLRRTVPVGGAMPEAVEIELHKLKAVVRLTQLREIASACGVPGSFRSANAVIEKMFEHVTGRALADAVCDTRVETLLQARDDAKRLEAATARLAATTSVTQIKRIARQLGVKGKIQSKPDGIAKLRAHLLASAKAAVKRTGSELGETDRRVTDIVGKLRVLKEMAHPQDAPEEQIKEELRRIAAQLNRDEAIAAAARFGVRRSVSSKKDAMRRIADEVFESKLMREKLRH